MGLSAVDKIAERHGLDGVYGLYRLFEVADQELTAGNRCVFPTYSRPTYLRVPSKPLPRRRR